MKATVLDVLMYLLERHMETEEAALDLEGMKRELGDLGIDEGQVERAFHWLEDLAEPYPEDPEGDDMAVSLPDSLRVFTAREVVRLDAECRGFLMFLEQAGILGPVERELTLERIMALDNEELSLSHVKWVVLMVLCNQPGREDAVTWIEQLLPDDSLPCFH